MKRKDNSDHITSQLSNLAKRLKQVRKAKGYNNYEYFCYQHQINRSSYSRWESGRDIQFSSLLKILKALDITVEEFFSEGFEEDQDE